MRLLRRFTPQRAGDGASAAHAEQVGDGREHDEGGINNGDGRRLVGIVQLSHEVSVGQIVDQQDHLAGDGRQNLLPHRLPVGERFKNPGAVLRSGHA